MQHTSTNFPIEALIDTRHPLYIRLSPDSSYVAFVMGQYHKKDKDTPPEQSIYIAEIATKKVRQLTTNHSGTNNQPDWSPDSQQLAFVSNRANFKDAQLYTIALHGGEAQGLTNLCGDVHVPRWSPDGSMIAFLYNGTLENQPHPDADPIVMDAEPNFDRVWLIHPETHELKPVTPATCHVFEYAWSPDGKCLVVLTSPHPNPAEGWYSAQLHSVNLESGEMRQICTMPHQIGRLTWSPDSTQIAFVSGIMSDEGNISGEVYIVPIAGGEARCITPGIDHSITWIEWHKQAIIYGGRLIESSVIGSINPTTGKTHLIFQGLYAINGQGPQSIHIANNGRFATVRQSFAEPPAIYTSSLDSTEWERLISSEVDTKTFPPLQVENRHWHNADGTPVQGFLVYPPDYKVGERRPMFVHVHGGPSWSYLPNYISSWERLIVARGCLVLLPNPRGSWGRGHAYQSSNVGDLGGGDWQDIQAGIDTVIADGLADPDRLAIGGWSYGGYLVTWAVTQTNRFRCAIAGASITNYESNYGVVSNREWQTTMFGSNVYEDYERHRSRSPIAFASKVKTPTLLLHGEQDKLAPVQQSIEFYIALKHFGIPTQLVIYPREPHGFEERAHQLDLCQRIGNWIDQYLLA
jgi:dipeptidyl aminopeptidase/acylaminoacyl peptidase